MYKKSLFWFRQDLRVYDNKGLGECLKQSEELLPLFILDTNIIPSFLGLEDKKFGFLRELLENLDSEIKKRGGSGLQVMLGNPQEVIPHLVKTYGIEAIFTNKSYSRYGTKRDSELKERITIPFFQNPDYLLVEPEQVEQRKVFTPFYKLWQKQIHSTDEQDIKKIVNFTVSESKPVSDFIKIPKHPYFTLDFGKERFEKYIRSDYNDFRNDLDRDGTSKLSPYLRMGVFSIRQIYNKAKEVSPVYVSELAWREFWQHIDHYFPNTKNEEFQEKRRHIKWEQESYLFDKWCQGETGYPVVDAAMKQLIETNRMHGRARMIVASFLTKDLHIDWRLGEAFFKKYLLDYDENVNFGNWQWSASVGADPKPLRIFSPILQSEKFDPRGIFIKKYLPELEGEKITSIHNPLENTLHYQKPIVDHRIETVRARELYKESSISQGEKREEEEY